MTFNPATDPKACSACKDEDVTYLTERTPSGQSPKIRCSNGHVTNGMPTAAYFLKYGGSQGNPMPPVCPDCDRPRTWEHDMHPEAERFAWCHYCEVSTNESDLAHEGCLLCAAGEAHEHQPEVPA